MTPNQLNTRYEQLESEKHLSASAMVELTEELANAMPRIGQRVLDTNPETSHRAAEAIARISRASMGALHDITRHYDSVVEDEELETLVSELTKVSDYIARKLGRKEELSDPQEHDTSYSLYARILKLTMQSSVLPTGSPETVQRKLTELTDAYGTQADIGFRLMATLIRRAPDQESVVSTPKFESSMREIIEYVDEFTPPQAA